MAAAKNICPWCGIANPIDATQCIGCGSELNAQPRTGSETVRLSNEVKQAASPAAEPRREAPKTKQDDRSRQGGPSKKSSVKSASPAIKPGYVYAAIAAVVIISYLYLKNDKTEPVVPQNTSLMQTDSTAQEIRSTEEFLASHPGDREASLRLANLLQDARRLPQAVGAYKKYLELDPKNADARTDMAICMFESGDSPSAITELKKALTYAPKHQPAMFNLGVVYLNQGNNKESNDWFSRCAAVDPSTPIAARAKQLLSQHSTTNKNLQ